MRQDLIGLRLTVRLELAKDTHSIDNTLFLLEQEKILHCLDTIVDLSLGRTLRVRLPLAG